MEQIALQMPPHWLVMAITNPVIMSCAIILTAIFTILPFFRRRQGKILLASIEKETSLDKINPNIDVILCQFYSFEQTTGNVIKPEFLFLQIFNTSKEPLVNIRIHFYIDLELPRNSHSIQPCQRMFMKWDIPVSALNPGDLYIPVINTDFFVKCKLKVIVMEENITGDGKFHVIGKRRYSIDNSSNTRHRFAAVNNRT